MRCKYQRENKFGLFYCGRNRNKENRFEDIPYEDEVLSKEPCQSPGPNNWNCFKKKQLKFSIFVQNRGKVDFVKCFACKDFRFTETVDVDGNRDEGITGYCINDRNDDEILEDNGDIWILNCKQFQPTDSFLNAKHYKFHFTLHNKYLLEQLNYGCGECYHHIEQTVKNEYFASLGHRIKCEFGFTPYTCDKMNKKQSHQHPHGKPSKSEMMSVVNADMYIKKELKMSD